MYQGRYAASARAHKRPARRKKVNKYFLVTLSLILLIGLAAGTTIAFLIAEGGSVENSFTPGVVECRVNDGYTVTNMGNVDAYIRVAVVVNWENSAGEINGIAPKEGTDKDYTLSLGSDWEKYGDYYYYQKVVTPTGDTKVTTPAVTVNPLTEAPSGFTLVTEVLAEAIQAEGLGENVTAQTAWEKAAQGN